MITRDFYLNRIRPYLGKPVIKAVTGRTAPGGEKRLYPAIDPVFETKRNFLRKHNLYR